jgi:hypothetical protein
MPSLEKLSTWSSRMTVTAAASGSLGFLSGIILNIVNQQHGLLGSVPWTDPVVLRMGALVVWLIIVAGTSRAMRQRAIGRRVIALLSLVSLTMLTISILWGVLGSTQHGLAPSQGNAAVITIPAGDAS